MDTPPSAAPLATPGALQQPSSFFPAAPPPRVAPLPPAENAPDPRSGPHAPVSSRTHRRAIACLATYVVLLGLVAFWPEHVDKGISPFLAELTKAIPLITYRRLEFGANIALFVPFGVLLALLLARRRYLVLPIAFLASLLIESVQAVLLPGRTPSVLDIVANTAGVCVGLLAVELIQLRRRRSR